MIYSSDLKKWSEERLMFEYNKRVESLRQARESAERAQNDWQSAINDVQALGRRDDSYVTDRASRKGKDLNRAQDEVRSIENELNQINEELSTR